MSTPAAPARLVIRFASDAGLAVVIRRGPSEWCQLVLWNLKTNEFTRGQWVHGVVKSSALSPNGKHLALQIQSMAKGKGYTANSLVSRAPFFTALAIEFGPASYTTIAFTKNGELIWTNHEPIEFRAANECPYKVIHRDLKFDELPRGSGMPRIDWEEYLGLHELETPGGRQILVREGKIYEKLEDREALLFDSSDDHFEEMKTPDWALRW